MYFPKIGVAETEKKTHEVPADQRCSNPGSPKYNVHVTFDTEYF